MLNSPIFFNDVRLAELFDFFGSLENRQYLLVRLVGEMRENRFETAGLEVGFHLIESEFRRLQREIHDTCDEEQNTQVDNPCFFLHIFSFPLSCKEAQHFMVE